MKNTPESPVSKEEKKASQVYDYIESLDVSTEEKDLIISTIKEFITLTFNKANEVATNAFIDAQSKMFSKDLENSIKFEKLKKHTKRLLRIIEDVKEQAPELICKDAIEECQEAQYDLDEINNGYKKIE